MDEEYTPAAPRRPSLVPWVLCVALLLGPALLAWAVRGVALAAQCAPGPDACRGVPLGAGLRDTLALDWMIVTNSLVLVGISILATLAAFRSYRPLLGTLSLMLLPLLALVLPMLVVFVSKYDDCPVSTDGIGSCTLWGAPMGMTFHTAATVPDIIYGISPYTFALTLMLGLLGFFFARPRPPAPPDTMTQLRRLAGDEE